MDGPSFGEPDVPLADEDAVTLMRRLIGTSTEPVTLVPTGPLTNVGRLLLEHPEVRTQIREIVWMGGSTARGNTTPYAEFNALVDPEAADQVVRSGVPLTMCGLNVTHQAMVTEDVVNRLWDIGTDLADVCVELMTFFAGRYRGLFGFDAPPLHDPVAVARVLDPSLVRCVEANLVVETKGEWTSGATCVDLYGNTGRPANAHVGVELDVPRFWDRFVDAVRALG
jgi:purine nucleosidase/pyrimidine-specific ribonucleoside hydrolase